MSKILTYLGRYVCINDPQKTVEVFRGFESTNVSISGMDDTSFDPVMKSSGQDIFDEGIWVRCNNGVEIDFRKNGLVLRQTDGQLLEFKKK
jgi:hypothetical protein